MSYLLEDILEYLVQNEICTGVGTDAFWDKVPDSPDVCYAVFEYDGMPEVPYEEAMHRSVQLICRASNSIDAKANATRVYSLIRSDLDEVGRIDFNGRFTQTTLRQTPFKMDEDEKSRVVYGFNMGITTSIDT